MKLRGIVPPLVTPMGENGGFDESGMERLVAHVTSAPVSGLFVLGTTGEGPSLDYQTRKDVIRTTSRLKPVETPLLVSVTDTSLVEMQALSDFAAAEGADYLVVAPPYYLTPGEARNPPLARFSRSQPASALFCLQYARHDQGGSHLEGSIAPPEIHQLPGIQGQLS